MALSADDIALLPYRPCVGLMLLNRDGRIFAGQRIDNPNNAWQMPQGGIDDDETPREAALRELREETGISPTHVEVLRESEAWRHYDLPVSLVPKLWSGRYRGQKQRWFALKFTGADSLVRIDTEEPEFRTWSWMDHDELFSKIVPFKRDTYGAVFAEFSDLLTMA